MTAAPAGDANPATDGGGLPATPPTRDNDHEFNVARFQQWALGNLVWNTNRGTFAEWIVGQALGTIADDDTRDEWGECDHYYRGHKIEVKTTGRGQAWKQTKRSTPQFGIRPTKQTWDKDTNEWTKLDPPARVADVYVFCLHTPPMATNANVCDPAFWEFWIVPTQMLNDRMGPREKIGLRKLRDLAPLGPVKLSEIRPQVDRHLNPA